MVMAAKYASHITHEHGLVSDRHITHHTSQLSMAMEATDTSHITHEHGLVSDRHITHNTSHMSMATAATYVTQDQKAARPYVLGHYHC